MDELIKTAPKKIHLYAFLGSLWSAFGLAGVLLLFFLHPRSMSNIALVFALAILLLLVVGDYFLLGYKLRHWKALFSFLNKANKKQEMVTLSFLKAEGVVFSSKMGFRKLFFLDENAKTRTFLLVEEITPILQEGTSYELSFYKDYLLSYREKGDEEE